MDLERWYRCNICGYMYTPQQFLALLSLESSPERDTNATREPISCRRKGCSGTLVLTDVPFKDARG